MKVRVRLSCPDCSGISLRPATALTVDPGPAHDENIVRGNCWWCRGVIEVTCVPDIFAIEIVMGGAEVDATGSELAGIDDVIGLLEHESG